MSIASKPHVHSMHAGTRAAEAQVQECEEYTHIHVDVFARIKTCRIDGRVITSEGYTECVFSGGDTHPSRAL